MVRSRHASCYRNHVRGVLSTHEHGTTRGFGIRKDPISNGHPSPVGNLRQGGVADHIRDANTNPRAGIARAAGTPEHDGQIERVRSHLEAIGINGSAILDQSGDVILVVINAHADTGGTAVRGGRRPQARPLIVLLHQRAIHIPRGSIKDFFILTKQRFKRCAACDRGFEVAYQIDGLIHALRAHNHVLVRGTQCHILVDSRAVLDRGVRRLVQHQGRRRENLGGFLSSGGGLDP